MAELTLLVVLLPLAGFLLAAAVRHARFCSAASTFRCKVRRAGAPGRSPVDAWPRRRVRALWVHDVLLLKRGALFPRLTALPVRIPEEALRSAGRDMRRLGADPLVILLRLDDGTFAEVAARSEDRRQLVGPFVAAALPGPPQGDRERPLGR
jgi:hypothetical protein